MPVYPLDASILSYHTSFPFCMLYSSTLATVELVQDVLNAGICQLSLTMFI